MPKKLSCYEVSRVTEWKDQVYHVTYKKRVPVSDINDLINQLIQSIQQENPNNFNTLISKRIVSFDCVKKDTPIAHFTTSPCFRKHETERHYHYTQPFMEVLFFEKLSQLKEIVCLLIEKNNQMLFNTFIAALKGTDLTEELVFSWTENMKDQVRIKLDVMLNYACKLMKKNNVKGRLLQRLYDKLDCIFDNYARDSKLELPSFSEANEIKNVQRFHNLYFKLKLTHALQQSDSALSIHQGLKRVVVNVIAILFSVGIANLINRVATGNWMFFNKTTSQEKIINIQEALMLPLQMQQVLKH